MNENMGNMPDVDTSQYPSVNLAYDFVKPSYDWLKNRLDAVDSRIEFLLTFSSSITIAAPIFVKALYRDINFWSLWFVAAMVIFVLIALVGLIGRIFGGLKLMSPQKLYNEWLIWSEWEFKKSAVYWAGQHFEYNASLINKKANFAILMSLLLVLEVVCIVIWTTSLK